MPTKPKVAAKPKAEEKEIAVIQPSDVAVASPEAIEALRQGSGENNGGASYEYVPTITVNGGKKEETIGTGDKARVVMVLTEPEFLVTTINENKEYVSEPFAPEFPGIILRTRYAIKKKWKEGDTTPFFFSAEFDTFSDEIRLIQNKKTWWTGAYKQLKIDFAEKFDLYAIIYIYSPEADKMYKTEFKGTARSHYWDYLKTFSRNDSVSAYITQFKAVTEKNEANLEYNTANFERLGINPDLQSVLIKQRELNNAINAREQANSSYDNVPKEDKAVEGEVVVPKVVF